MPLEADRARTISYADAMSRIILVRHGPTRFNAEGRLQGRMDLPLSNEGLYTAEVLASRVALLVRDTPDSILLTSPLLRARSTAEIIGVHANLVLKIEHRLAEVSFGCWEGLTLDEINSGWPATGRSVRLSWADCCPDGEQYVDAVRRADDWLQDLGDRNVIVVTHGVFGSLIRGRYAGLCRDEMLRLPVDHDLIAILSDGAEQRLQS